MEEVLAHCHEDKFPLAICVLGDGIESTVDSALLS